MCVLLSPDRERVGERVAERERGAVDVEGQRQLATVSPPSPAAARRPLPTRERLERFCERSDIASLNESSFSRGQPRLLEESGFDQRLLGRALVIARFQVL